MFKAMTNSESHFIEEVYSFSIALRGSGRKRKIPFLLDEGTPITFNGHQSLGEYASYLNQLLSQIREELCQTRSPHSQVLALIMADLAVLLESRRLLPLNEKHFDKSWSTVIKMPELMEEIETKTALFRETQYYAFRRWEAMRKSLEGFTTAKNFIDNDRCNDPEGPFGFGSNAQATTTYNWTGTLTDAVEVSLGLVDAGLIQFPAKATQEQKLQSLAIAFRMEIGQANLNQTLSQLLNRKSGPIKALDHMKQAILVRQQRMDAR